MINEIKPLPILIEGHPTLRKKCVEVAMNNPDVAQWAMEMHATLNATADVGVGLAAPQIGYAVRMFVMGGIGTRPVMPKITFINPEILELKGGIKNDMEGCLSVPLIYRKIDRYQKVKLQWTDVDGILQCKTFKGFQARVVQHEMDHMDGIEFYDHLPADQLKDIEVELVKIRDGNIPSSVKYKYEIYTPTSSLDR